MNFTGAELIIRFLERRARPARGRGAVAIVAGGSALKPLKDELVDSELRRVPAAAADSLLFGYRAGLLDAAPVLAEACLRQRPLLAIAVQVRRSLIGSAGHQPEDTRRALDPLCKQWFHVNAAAELVQLLPEACSLADGGRPGPVLLEVPEDVLTELVQGAWIPQPPSIAHTSRALSSSLQYA